MPTTPQITVTQVITDMMLLWGIEDPNVSASASRARCFLDLNRAVQMLWANAAKLDYFSQTTITKTLTANTESLVFDETIQKIEGPVRLASTKAPLNPIRTRFELENYAPVYMGLSSVPNGTPLAYYLQREYQNEASSVLLSLYPVPIPAVDTDILLDIILEAPGDYTTDDFDGATVIPIPHAYGESILIPLCRHAAMSHFLFCVPTRAPMIEAEYSRAMLALGLVAPEVDEISKEAPPEVNAPWVQRRDK